MSVPAGAIPYRTLQDMVLANGFAEAQRSDARAWLNFRYGWIYGLEEWTFRRDSATVQLAAGQQQQPTALPAYFGSAVKLQLSDGSELRPMDWGEFQRRYYGSTVQGTPAAFTVMNGVLFVAPAPSAQQQAQLLFLRGLCHLDQSGTVQAGPMTNDYDYPALPAEHHPALVLGAKATGFRLTNVPMAQLLEQDFSNSITAMRSNYLDDILAQTDQAPLDQIAYW